MRRWAIPGAIAVAFAGALLIKIDAPFLRHREAVDAFFATVARNQVAMGYSQTRLGIYEIPDAATRPYPNRPFLTPFVTSLWFQVFGSGEAVLRLSLIVASIGTLLAFFLLATRLLGERGGLLALALFAFNPLFWYFSLVAVHLVYVLGFSLAAWLCWLRWDEARRFRIGTYAFLFLACASDWPGYYAALSIAIDAFAMKRRALGASLLAFALGCFGLHLAHLAVLGGVELVRRFLAAPGERSGFPNPIAFLASEGRELGLYVTLGLLVLSAAGLRGLPRRIWLLALLGLDEIVFMRWAIVHDYLSFPLAAFFALTAARGAMTLRRPVAIALLALAAIQSLWIVGDRLTREGANEVLYRAGLAIREGTRPDDRVLLTIADERQFTPYYAGRLTAGVEPGEPNLMIHPSGARWPVARVEDLEPHFRDYTVVLVGDPAAAAKEIRFFQGRRPPEEFRFLDPEHPLRRTLESRAIARETRGAFILYRLR